MNHQNMHGDETEHESEEDSVLEESDDEGIPQNHPAAYEEDEDTDNEEMEEEEITDLSTLNTRLEEFCKCKERTCFKAWSNEELQATRKFMYSMSQDDRRTFLMVHSFLTCDFKGQKDQCILRGKKVCNKVFMLLCSKLGVVQPRTQTLSTMIKDLKNPTNKNIVELPADLGKRRLPQKGLKRNSRIKDTIHEFLNEVYIHAMDVPEGRKFKKAKDKVESARDFLKPVVRVLSCTESVASLWEKLEKELEEDGSGIIVPNVTYRNFCKVFSAYPYLQINTGKTDYCDFCFVIDSEITYEMNDVIKSNKEVSLARHKEDAHRERVEYHRQINSGIPHISFDMAASVPIPRLQTQVGPLYFKCEWKVRVFGVCEETKKHQVNYLLPEGTYPQKTAKGGKGPNLILSLLNHFLNGPNAPVGRILLIHADSCAGQNKNQYVFNYIIILVFLGVKDEIMMSFMIPGHTKFPPDGYFGNAKRKFFEMDASVVTDVQHAFESRHNSSLNCMDAEENSLHFYDFKKYIDECFNGRPSAHAGSSKIVRFHCKRDENNEVVFSLSKRCDEVVTEWTKLSTLSIAEHLPTLSNFKENRTPLSKTRHKQLQEIGAHFVVDPVKKREWNFDLARVFAPPFASTMERI